MTDRALNQLITIAFDTAEPPRWTRAGSRRLR
jgi:hypothetical protein